MFLRAFIKALSLLVFSLPAIIVILMIDRQPGVSTDMALSAQELETIQKFLIDNDPRGLLYGQNRTIAVTDTEADILLKYFFSQNEELAHIKGQLRVTEGSAELLLTLPVNTLLFGQYLNLNMAIDEQGSPARISGITAGSIHLPRSFISPVLNRLDQRLANHPDYKLLLSLLDSIKDLQLEQGRASFALQFDNEQISSASVAARDLMLTESQQSRISVYYSKIIDVEQDVLTSGVGRTSVNTFLQALFNHAYEQVLDGNDPVAENRALFLALATYITDRGISTIAPGDSPAGISNHRRRITVTLNNRSDLAQHLVVSAAMASNSGTGFSQLISVYKEVIDSRTRSGFSFDDITANTAGTGIGSLSAETGSVAHRLQFIMKSIEDESEYMPPSSNAPTLSEREFTQLYGDRNSEAWTLKMQEIGSQIEARPLFDRFNRSVTVSASGQ